MSNLFKEMQLKKATECEGWSGSEAALSAWIAGFSAATGALISESIRLDEAIPIRTGIEWADSLHQELNK